MMQFNPGKTVLVILVCVVIIAIITIISSLIFNDEFINSGILNSGATAILVLITIWYAGITEKNVKIIERGSQGKYIAEISRSIFSPMLKDLAKARVNLINGSFLLGISSKPTLEGIDPVDVYLEGNIFIYSLRARSAQQPMARGGERPASSLLKTKDDILKKHYSDIKVLTRKYSDTRLELIRSIQQISTHLPLVWNDYKNICNSLDSYNLQDYFTEKSIENPNESNYCLIFRTIISNKEYIGNPTYYCLALNNIDGQKDLFLSDEYKRKFYNLGKFTFQNKEELNRWLSESKINQDITHFQEIRMDLIKANDELTRKIEELLLDWKIEYYLTEDEMHLDEENWTNSQIF